LQYIAEAALDAKKVKKRLESEELLSDEEGEGTHESDEETDLDLVSNVNILSVLI
jgi:hypothetical protein